MLKKIVAAEGVVSKRVAPVAQSRTSCYPLGSRVICNTVPTAPNFGDSFAKGFQQGRQLRMQREQLEQNVAAIVNFAGGRGGRNRGRPDSDCSPKRLVAAAAEFGRTARIPTLWLHAENDSFFPPDLSRKMEAAYTAAGGKAEFVLLPPGTGGGHGLINASPPAAPWVAPLQQFLARNS